ncbi:hypothetical protein RND81_11G109700 [Saponaria officinalis]|uniref:Zinc finger GRF-type domain-containing protein n=1 Tax=Saponaria officinalis TaxID=3572 RepID=A0AAW1HKE5_SAPOF
MSSFSSFSSNPIEGLEFRNQPCNLCRRNAVIKISGSRSNPRKAYFKCLECDNFVKWVSDEHVIVTKSFKSKPSIEEFEISSSDGISELLVGFNRDVLDFFKYMKRFMKIVVFMFFFVVVVVVLK